MKKIESFTKDLLSREFENIISENIQDEKRIKQLIYLQIERTI